MYILTHIISSVSTVFKNFFESDMDVMSSDAKEIFRNPSDKEQFLKTIKELRKLEIESKGEKFERSKKITLSNNKQITLTI
ncbi:hypothetical protein J5U18_12710 [Sphingobacteriaceae bacterium WQ 2009]|uniref:Uncharacterized protein n=1 Tax=Rhinopithecimicrobium faecis TaxID=2820698 RepID=A0A8T4HBL1_9SPHI|nr:hypothetical protein [Sphingobacteriaceae bacterium WQ 2009]